MSEQITFKLNDKDVTVPKGWTVMQAATREKVAIPHFCWHPGLSVAGVCRFCMVKVVGRPKLEIACNLEATEGLEVSTESKEVQESHKWALEFHLINHPLDCPICDQAGECELQNSYMKVGKYESQMTNPKVLKPKALEVGSELVLDTERCILCSRCVRFEEEVTNTNALGIFDRGDRAIIGTYNNEKIDHNYQENLVDICPVGAFTSKKFRFKQRVWFMEERETICNGCSTGCSIKVHGKPEKKEYFRIKPAYEKEVNGHWICDYGRTTHESLNYINRFDGDAKKSLKELASIIKATKLENTAILVAPQYTNEEFEAFFNFFIKKLGINNIFQWREEEESRDFFDGILLRGDYNSNTQGLINYLDKFGKQSSVKDEFQECLNSSNTHVIALCPQQVKNSSSVISRIKNLTKKKKTSLWTMSCEHIENSSPINNIPMKGFYEKTGTIINHQKKERILKECFSSAVQGALNVVESIDILKSELNY